MPADPDPVARSAAATTASPITKDRLLKILWRTYVLHTVAVIAALGAWPIYRLAKSALTAPTGPGALSAAEAAAVASVGVGVAVAGLAIAACYWEEQFNVEWVGFHSGLTQDQLDERLRPAAFFWLSSRRTAQLVARLRAPRPDDDDTARAILARARSGWA